MTAIQPSKELERPRQFQTMSIWLTKPLEWVNARYRNDAESWIGQQKKTARLFLTKGLRNCEILHVATEQTTQQWQRSSVGWVSYRLEASMNMHDLRREKVEGAEWKQAGNAHLLSSHLRFISNAMRHLFQPLFLLLFPDFLLLPRYLYTLHKS